MLEKLKDKLPMMGKKGEEMMKKPSVEIEIGEDEEEEMPEEGMGEEEEVAVGKLAEFSDEELMAEMKKRGLKGGAPEPELPMKEEEEEEEMPA